MAVAHASKAVSGVTDILLPTCGCQHALNILQLVFVAHIDVLQGQQRTVHIALGLHFTMSVLVQHVTMSDNE